MECAEIRSGFVSGQVPEGPAVDEHLKWCPHCRELFEKGAQLGRRLAAAVLPAAPPGDLFAKIDADLALDVGLRARLRALPTPVRAVALASVGLMLPALQLLMHPRSDFGHYSQAVFWTIAALLLALLAYGSWRLLRSPNAPLRAAQHDGAVAFWLVALPALVVFLAPLGITDWGVSESDPLPERLASWGHPGLCFTYGAVLVVPFLILLWLFERRDRVPLLALVSAGALSGVAANLLLHAHCPSAHWGHLLLGHASVGAAWALGLSLFGRRLARSG